MNYTVRANVFIRLSCAHRRRASRGRIVKGERGTETAPLSLSQPLDPFTPRFSTRRSRDGGSLYREAVLSRYEATKHPASILPFTRAPHYVRPAKRNLQASRARDNVNRKGGLGPAGTCGFLPALNDLRDSIRRPLLLHRLNSHEHNVRVYEFYWTNYFPHLLTPRDPQMFKLSSRYLPSCWWGGGGASTKGSSKRRR